MLGKYFFPGKMENSGISSEGLEISGVLINSVIEYLRSENELNRHISFWRIVIRQIVPMGWLR